MAQQIEQRPATGGQPLRMTYDAYRARVREGVQAEWRPTFPAGRIYHPRSPEGHYIQDRCHMANLAMTSRLLPPFEIAFQAA